MTKADAIEKVMQEHNGVATLKIIYNEIEKFYPKAKASQEWQAGIRGVLYRDIGTKFKRIDDATYAVIEYNYLDLLPLAERQGVTEKDALVKVRVLQYKYRERLLRELKKCPITGVRDKRLLIASHIKPWSLSDDFEKLDIYNGFILTPLYDRLFDRGLITFTTQKELIISSSLSKATIQKLNLVSKIYDNLPVCGREKYLEYHNNNIFLCR